MKLLWIEDFLTLADSGSFSRAAALRHVTQPAFSRRIRALESWLGVELVDRHSQPLRLTATAQRRIPEFRGLLRDINHLRSSLQSENAGAVRIMLATQHSLTMTRLPALLGCFSGGPAPRIEFTVRSENHDECVVLFMRGEVDLLLSMEDPDDPLCRQIPPQRRLSMGVETLVPLSVPDKTGQPLHAPKAGQPLNLLAFPPGSYLGRIMYAQCFNRLFQTCHVQIVHESVFLAGVKEMLLAGLGMAWLPKSLVERELATGSLVLQADALPRIALNVSLYRSEHGNAPQTIDRIWQTLVQHTSQGPADQAS